MEYFSKFVLKVTGMESTMACQDDQIFAELEAVIDDAIHGVQAVRDKNWSTEEWYFLLVDAKNTFNEIN